MGTHSFVIDFYCYLKEENRLLESSAREATTALVRLAQITDAFESINATAKSSSATPSAKITEIKRILADLHSSGDI